MNFRSNALAMLAGTLLAQAIPLIASPYLARVYGPEAFGIQTLFMGSASALAVLATFRFDLAIVLPKSDEEAGQLAAMALATTSAVCLVLLVVVAFFSPTVARVVGQATDVTWLWMLPVMVAVTAFAQLCVAFASRGRCFQRVATANVLNQVIYVAVAIASGITGAWLLGLALAKLAGQSSASSLLAVSGGTRPKALQLPGWQAVKVLISKYRQFIFFNTPYSLIGTISRDAPIFIYSLSAATVSAGYYGLARTILMAPTLLASNALSQVFYREAVALTGTPRLQTLTITLLKTGLTVGAPLFAFCTVWSDEVFAIVFGAQWRTAGIMAMLMAPAAWMSAQTGWPERLFEVHMRQGTAFSVQLGSDLTTAILFAITWLATRNAVLSIAVFAVCNVIYHHVYLWALFRVSGFSASSLVAVLLIGWGMYLSFAAFFAVFRMLGGTGWSAIGSSLVAALAAAAIGALRASRAARRNASLREI